MRGLKVLLFACLMAAFVQPALALTTIVDTGTPTALGGGSSLQSNSFVDQDLAGGPFTLGGPATIDTIEGYITTTAPGTVQFKVLNDSAGVPGTEVFSIDVALGVSSGWQSVTGLTWNLGAGSYWIAFIATGDYVGYMDSQPPAKLPKLAFTNGSPAWSINSSNSGIGIRVLAADGETALVPEPATWSLLIIGFAGLALIRRRTASA